MLKPATPLLPAAVLAVAALLGGCGEDAPPASTRNTAALAPSDPALAKIYDSSCKLCHANPASGAPQTGDAKAWQPRLAQGGDSLLDHSINGYKGMPPMGMCMQCSEDEFLALISFMSGQQVR
ncbi:c-type cytochrome [Pseudomonas sp. ZM23]|uniref:C-type cytochrome n=1 Tax=Pseudomonas triclosanedens TaxID=2961893 RepID=A0ABY6ZT05_9PSED|nr:c-type cytochrome [Pseudomonas triclosanedens]MCP8466184.1 c-type cytochrome [Pseudomonas triclosanedens]MCP8472419.1 c-type cytochrome [Pseudomonas triclosanedens]MCP8477483.1 c-type cytochrome [Pseudomonas triclosanedens]WAI47185.1 c-type cytochrome [Pseudomonas triclosanedens]